VYLYVTQRILSAVVSSYVIITIVTAEVNWLNLCGQSVITAGPTHNAEQDTEVIAWLK